MDACRSECWSPSQLSCARWNRTIRGAEAADETAESALRKIGFRVKPSPQAVSAQKNRVLGTSVMFS